MTIALSTQAPELAASLATLFERDGADERRLETSVLAVVQEIHCTIHRAFVDYQSASEERRQVAVNIGELAQQRTDALTAAGWTEKEARNANVNDLAEGRRDDGTC